MSRQPLPFPNNVSHTHRWFILKPGFADRAQGIRLFSTQDELYVARPTPFSP